MEVSVVWLGLGITILALLFLLTRAKGVYDAFQNYDTKDEGFIGSSQNDIRLTSCPADYKQFVNNDGQIQCCDGTPNSGKCSGKVICSLSEGEPTCSTWYTAVLDEKGRNKCPPSMPNYFETKDGKIKGCTSGKRKPDGSGPLETSAKFCKLYTSQRDDEGKVDSCTNVMLLDKTVCFPGSSVKVDKKLVSVQNGSLPAQVQCIFSNGSCISESTTDRYYSALQKQQNKPGSWRDTFTRWDPLDKINLCSITQKYKINKTIGFQDLPSINLDGKVTAPKANDYVMYGKWIGSEVTVQKISSLPNGDKIYMIFDGKYTKAVREDNKSAKYYQGKLENFNVSNWNSYPDATGAYLVKRK